MVVPFLIVYIFNWAVFSIIIVSLLIKTFRSNIKSKNNINVKFVRQQLIIAVTLSVMFGLGWGIGLLATQDIHTNKTVRDLFAAFFVLITAFHGLFIFIMHCLRSREVRTVWKRWFFNVSRKDFNELTTSVFSTKRNKSYGVSSSLYTTKASNKQERETIRETDLYNMKTKSKIEHTESFVLNNPMYSIMASVNPDKENIYETVLDNTKTESEIEDVMSTERTFTEDENEKKMLKVEGKYHQS